MKTVKLLCEYGANLHQKDNSSLTVLEYAVSRREFETTKFLNEKSGIVYPDLENVIRKHKAERDVLVKELVKRMQQMPTEDDLPMP